MIARLRRLPGNRRAAVERHFGEHEQVEAVVNVIGRQPIFALRFGLDVVAVGVGVEAVGAFVDIGAASRKKHVIPADRVFQNIEQRTLARRRGPQERAFGRIEAVHRPGAAAVHGLLIVVQVETIEVDTLQSVDLLDAQNLAREQFDRLAGPRLQHVLPQDRAGAHRAVPAGVLAACSRRALRMRAARSGASPLRTVRSISSSCCWFSLTTIVL